MSITLSRRVYKIHVKQRAQGLTRSSTPVSLLGLLKNPMILIGIFGMGMMIGMPYLLDNSMFLLSLIYQPPISDASLIHSSGS